MRRLALFLFLAGSALPALAAVDDEDRRPQRAQQAERSSSQSEPRERPSRAERMEARREAIGAMRAQSREHAGVDRQGSVQRQAVERSSQEPGETRRRTTQQSGQDRNFQRQWQSRERRFESETPVVQGGDGIVPRQREIRTVPDANPTQQVGTRHRDRDRDRYDGRHAGRHRDWSRDWRSDRRYDWRRWRDRNRSSFRLGFYFDPFGWGYRRYSIGSYLYPSYYSSRYWLNDPWSYRLPPAWGPYRWVRYHNDAILIDTWTGEVVDVIYNFFW